MWTVTRLQQCRQPACGGLCAFWKGDLTEPFRQPCGAARLLPMFEYRPSLGRRVRGLCIQGNLRASPLSPQEFNPCSCTRNEESSTSTVHASRTRTIRIYATLTGWGQGVQVFKPLEEELVPWLQARAAFLLTRFFIGLGCSFRVPQQTLHQ